MCSDSFETIRRFNPSYALRTVAGLVLIISFAGSAGADDVTFGFAAGMGGTSATRGEAIAVDTSGNVYTTGYFWNTADFDPGAGTANLTSADKGDIFVSKLDSAGNFVWAKRMGGMGNQAANGIAVDASGNVYTTGYLRNTADFDPGSGTVTLTSAGETDIFVSKLDSAGNFVWAKRMGGTRSAGGYGIAVDESGNVYTTGSFRGTVDFDPGAGTADLTNPEEISDIFISKLDSAGNFVWAKAMGGTTGAFGYDIAVDGSGNVYTTGWYYVFGDFDPGEDFLNFANFTNFTGANRADINVSIFVSKLDSAGNLVWARVMGGTTSAFGYGIAVDGSGNVYTTGKFRLTVDFDPGPGTANRSSAAGSTDIFVSKLDSSGNFVWAKGMGGPVGGGDVGRGIAVDASGNVYTSGYFEGTGDFDPGLGTANLTSAGGVDVFVSKLDSAGNFVWAKAMGSPSEGGTFGDYGRDIGIDASSNVYTTGYFKGTADFDPGEGTANLINDFGRDAFVSKLVATGPVLTVWVDFGFDGGEEYGSHDKPFDTLAEGLANVVETGTVKIMGDTEDSGSNETMTIDQAVTLEAVNGTVRIGDAVVRSADKSLKSGFVSRN